MVALESTVAKAANGEEYSPKMDVYIYKCIIRISFFRYDQNLDTSNLKHELSFLEKSIYFELF